MTELDIICSCGEPMPPAWVQKCEENGIKPARCRKCVRTAYRKGINELFPNKRINRPRPSHLGPGERMPKELASFLGVPYDTLKVYLKKYPETFRTRPDTERGRNRAVVFPGVADEVIQRIKEDPSWPTPYVNRLVRERHGINPSAVR